MLTSLLAAMPSSLFLHVLGGSSIITCTDVQVAAFYDASATLFKTLFLNYLLLLTR